MAATRIAGAPGRLLGALILLALAPPLPVAAAGWNVQPTARQLERLARAEPYIRYFTSLEYGRDGARVPAEYMRALVLTERLRK